MLVFPVLRFERTSAHTSLIIHSSKPGVIIGRSGTAVEDLKKNYKEIWGAFRCDDSRSEEC